MNISSDSTRIYHNAIITYDDGRKGLFDAISITDKGVYTGTIRLGKGQSEEFIDDGLISKDHIKQIRILYNNGTTVDLDF
jgi:hypothetical protein